MEAAKGRQNRSWASRLVKSGDRPPYEKSGPLEWHALCSARRVTRSGPQEASVTRRIRKLAARAARPLFRKACCSNRPLPSGELSPHSKNDHLLSDHSTFRSPEKWHGPGRCLPNHSFLLNVKPGSAGLLPASLKLKRLPSTSATCPIMAGVPPSLRINRLSATV
jgi:hypothetical protein